MKKAILSWVCVGFGVMVLGGCQSDRSTLFAGRNRQNQGRSGQYGNGGGYGAYGNGGYDSTGWESGPTTRVNEAAREATRKAGLEAQVSRLQSQVDALSAAQEGVVAQANATVSRSNASQDSVRVELDTLRMEIAALKSENKALREELNAQRSQIAALPNKITTAVLAAQPKQSSGGSGSGRGSSGSGSSRGGSRECYEHVVASGDTVSAIAAAYGVSSKEIVRENNLKDAGAIRVGQTLYIPKK